MLQDIDGDAQAANSHRLEMLAAQKRVALELRAEVRMVGSSINRAVVIQAAAGALENQHLDFGSRQRSAKMLLDRLTRELRPFGKITARPFFAR